MGCRDLRGLTEAAARPAQVISQLKSVVGVKIRISDREDFVPGTRNRKVTISGTADAVQIAQVKPARAPHTRTPVLVPARPQVATRARPRPRAGCPDADPVRACCRC